MRYQLTLIRMAIIKSLQIINAGEAMEKMEPCYIIDWNINLCSHYGEQYGGSSKNYK